MEKRRLRKREEDKADEPERKKAQYLHATNSYLTQQYPAPTGGYECKA